MDRKFTAHQPAAAPTARAKPAMSRAQPPQGTTPAAGGQAKTETTAPKPKQEIGGPSGPEPTRYGDWERKGICVDF